MDIEPKIENPVCIRFGDSESVILADEINKYNTSLVPGAMFAGNHYGFVLITDINGIQKEMVYPTQCRIVAVAYKGGTLKIFEEGKRTFWSFNNSGKLEHSIFGEFTDEYRSRINTSLEYCDIIMGEPILKNPLCVKIARNSERSVILKDEYVKQDYPLYPGAILETEHYGFVLIIDTDKGQKEVYYPTQNRVAGIGTVGDEFGDLMVFEKGKSYPWLFSYDGIFKQEALYNPYSISDKAFVESVYGLNMKDAVACFNLKIK